MPISEIMVDQVKTRASFVHPPGTRMAWRQGSQRASQRGPIGVPVWSLFFGLGFTLR